MSSAKRDSPSWADAIDIFRAIDVRKIIREPLQFDVPPLILFFLIGAIVHRNLAWALGLLLTLLVEHAWLIGGSLAAGTKQAREALWWFANDSKAGPQFVLEEVPTAEIVTCLPGHTWADICSARKHQYLTTPIGRQQAGLLPNFVPLRVFIVKTHALASIRSYGSLVSTSFVFLTEHPSSLAVVERFTFLHEIAHTTFGGCLQVMRRYSKTASIVFAAWVIFCTVFLAAPVGATVVAAFLLLWGWGAWNVSMFAAEIYADSRALVDIADCSSVEKIIGVFRTVWNEDSVETLVGVVPRSGEHRRRLRNMESVLRRMKALEGKGRMAVNEGGNSLVIKICTCLAVGWIAIQSPAIPWIGLMLMLLIVVRFWHGLSDQFASLIEIEERLGKCIEEKCGTIVLQPEPELDASGQTDSSAA